MWDTLKGLGSIVTKMIIPTEYNEEQNKQREIDNPQNNHTVDKQIQWELVLKNIKSCKYEEAAEMLSIDERLKQALGNEDNGLTVKDRLQSVCLSQYFQSVIEGKHEDSPRYAILYAESGGKLQLVLDFLFQQCKTNLEREESNIQGQIKDSLEKPNANVMQKNCIDAIGKLFKNVAKIVENHAYIEQVFNTQSFLQIIKNVQPVCEKYALEYIRLYIDHKKINKTESLINQDPRLMAGLLDDVILIQQHVEMYKRFIRKHYEIGINKLKDKGYIIKNDSIEMGDVLIITNYVEEPEKLYKAIENLLEIYLQINSLYLSTSLEEILKMEDSNEFNSPDDTFIIYKKCIQRTASTRESGLLVKILNQINEVVIKFSQRLHEKLVTSLPNPKNLLNADKGAATRCFNDIALCVSYSKKLKEDTEKICERIWKKNSDEVEKNIKVISKELLKINEFFANFAKEEVKLLVKPIFNSIVGYIRNFARTNYQMNIEDFKNSQINDPWVDNYIGAIKLYYESYEAHSNEESKTFFFDEIMKYTAIELEETIKQKYFSQYGGLQFSSDLAKLMTFFDETTKKSVRSKFIRLWEIKDILTLERVGEILDYWGTSEVQWSLTNAEVKLFLKRREFAESSIDRLKL